MITEFGIHASEGKYGIFHSENFPIDLKIGDKIWLSDFVDIIKYGRVYNIVEEEEEESDVELLGFCEVEEMVYGKENGVIVKMLQLKFL